MTMSNQTQAPRNSLAALTLAGCVFGVLLVQHIANGVFSVVGAVASGSQLDFEELVSARSVLLDLVFVVGVFLTLWLISPIAAGLRLTTVILRGVLISAGGAVLVLVAILLFGLSEAIGGLIGLQTGLDIGTAVQSVGSGIWSAGGYFVGTTPLVVLAAILLWIWLARHPSNTPVSEIVGQV